MAKSMTNDKRFNNLFKELRFTIHEALLRERIVKIMEMTMRDIKENPQDWEKNYEKSAIHPSVYEELNTIVQKHLGFNN